MSTTNHGPESVPCRGTSTRCLTNMEWIWYYMAITTTTTTYEDIYPLKHNSSAIDRPTMTSTTRRYSYRLELEAVGSAPMDSRWQE